MATATKYKRLADLMTNPPKPKKATPEQIGKSMTIPGQAMTLKDIVQRGISGFPVPMQREEIKLPEDVNQLLQGTKYDVVSDVKFRKMSKIERQRYINNLNGLNQGVKEKLDKAIADKQAVDAQQSQIEATPQETETPQ